jgi:hypothetical protein
MSQEDIKNDVTYEKTGLDEKTLGANILNAPQPVTTPPSSFTMATGSGGSYISSSNQANLQTIAETVYEMYQALLKEGLIKKK